MCHSYNQYCQTEVHGGHYPTREGKRSVIIKYMTEVMHKFFWMRRWRRKANISTSVYIMIAWMIAFLVTGVKLLDKAGGFDLTRVYVL